MDTLAILAGVTMLAVLTMCAYLSYAIAGVVGLFIFGGLSLFSMVVLGLLAANGRRESTRPTPTPRED